MQAGAKKVGARGALLATLGIILPLLAAAPPAYAQEVELVDRVETGDGNFRWRYRVFPGVSAFWARGAVPAPGVTPEDTRPNGRIKDYVTIYDVAGFTGSVQVERSHFADVSYLVGSTPTGTAPSDNAAIPNVTIYRVGDLESLVRDPFTFSIRSRFGAQRVGYYTTDATKHAPGKPTHRTGVSSVGRVEVPRVP